MVSSKPKITETEQHEVGLAVDTTSDTLVPLAQLDPANMTATALAAFVLQCHERGTQAVLTAAEWFWRAGNALIHAKESKKYGQHGDWEQWVRNKCKISPSQARKYKLWARQVNESEVKSFANERFDLEKALGFRSNEEEGEEAQPIRGTSRSTNGPVTVPEEEEAQPIKGTPRSTSDPATVPEEGESGEEDRRYSLTVIIRLSPEINGDDLEDLLKTDQVHWVLKNGNGRRLGGVTVESVEDLQRA